MSDKVGLILEADRLGQERDAARAERDKAREEAAVWRAAKGYWHDLAGMHLQQRDEARDLVRAALQGTDLRARRESLMHQYPWLKENEVASDE